MFIVHISADTANNTSTYSLQYLYSSCCCHNYVITMVTVYPNAFHTHLCTICLQYAIYSMHQYLVHTLSAIHYHVDNPKPDRPHYYT